MTNILIVDDQPCVRELLSEELICEGYRVAGADDAESVRRHLRSLRPDLVLLDLYLDGPDGFEVLHDIKKKDPHLPVIIYTAYDSYRDDPRLSQADSYLIKSIVLDELKQKITDLLSEQPASHQEVEAKTYFPDRRVRSRWEGNAMNKHEILLVDDSPAILRVMGSALEDKGYQVTTAASGKLALEALAIKEFDLVITDLNMSEIDGLGVLKNAKEVNPGGGVMILTGNRDVGPAIQALRLGADDYILKPCNLSELLERVANCLERSEPDQRRARPDSRIQHEGGTAENIKLGPTYSMTH